MPAGCQDRACPSEQQSSLQSKGCVDGAVAASCRVRTRSSSLANQRPPPPETSNRVLASSASPIQAQLSWSVSILGESVSGICTVTELEVRAVIVTGTEFALSGSTAAAVAV